MSQEDCLVAFAIIKIAKLEAIKMTTVNHMRTIPQGPELAILDLRPANFPLLQQFRAQSCFCLKHLRIQNLEPVIEQKEAQIQGFRFCRSQLQT